MIHVRAQLSRARRGDPARRVAPKTAASARDVPGEWWGRHPRSAAGRVAVRDGQGHPARPQQHPQPVLAPAVAAAEQLLAERESSDSFATKQREDGKRVTHVPSHAGRPCDGTWWAEAGYDERDVMLWVGHEDPALTLRLYRQARNRPRDPRVAAAMAEVPAAERKAPARRRPA